MYSTISVDTFSDNALDYINNWTEHFDVFQSFTWILLEQFPDWTTVKNSMRTVGEKASFDVTANSSSVFEQFGYMKSYCSAEKLMEWRNEKLPTDRRWTEIFKHMEDHHVPYDEFAKIVEFILCFAGTSSPVERVFAKAKKIWKQESSQLQVSTLGSLLQIKCNMDWTCTEFFNFLKSRPDLLRQIAANDKYKPADSPMSVQFAETDSE